MTPWEAPDLLSRWERVRDLVAKPPGPPAQDTRKEDLGETLVEAGRLAPTWASLPFKQRAALLRRIASTIEGHLEELAALAIQETGKPWWLALREAIETARQIQRFCDGPTALSAEPPSTGADCAGGWIIRSWHPLGVWIIVTPAVSPLFLPAILASTALLGGNAVILVPNQNAEGCARKFVEIVHASGIPRGVIQLTGGPLEGLLGSLGKDIATGVCLAGAKEQAVPLKERLLDPSQGCFHLVVGRSSVLVLDQQGAEAAIEEVALWSLAHTGQVIGAPDLILVHHEFLKGFRDGLVQAMDGLQAAPPTDRDTVLGPLIEPMGPSKLDAWRQSLTNRGKTFILPNEVPQDDGWVQPVLYVGPFDASLLGQEIPPGGLALCPVGSPQEALEIVRDRTAVPFTGIYSESFGSTDPRLRGIFARGVFTNRFPGPEQLALAGELEEHEDAGPLIERFLRRQTLYHFEK